MLQYLKSLLFAPKREFSNTFMYSKKVATYTNGAGSKIKPMTIDRFLTSDWFLSGNGEISIPITSVHEDAEERAFQFSYWTDLADKMKANIKVRNDYIILSKRPIRKKLSVKNGEKIVTTTIYKTEDGKVERKKSNIAAVASIVRKSKAENKIKNGKPSVPSASEKPKKKLGFGWLKRAKKIKEGSAA